MNIENCKDICSMTRKAVYLDFNATTPLASEVLEAVYFSLKYNWGNPSSPYSSGLEAKQVIEEARKHVAHMVGAKSSDIIFTSGGTESNNLVIHSAIQFFHNWIRDKHQSCTTCSLSSNKSKHPHIITTNIEHDSVKLPLEHLVSQGLIDVTFVPVSKVTGQIQPEDILSAVQANTCLISVMLANNETGIIQPVAEIAEKVCYKNKERSRQQCPLAPILLHTDAAQALGKIPVNVSDLDVDFLTVVGHKFYGPRTGALFVRENQSYSILYPFLFGGGQERGYRPGTENTAMIAGLGKAAELVVNNLDTFTTHMEDIRNYLENQLKVTFGESIGFNSQRYQVPRLPNTSSIAFLDEKLSGQDVLGKATTLQVSTGAACHKTSKPSSVLLASGVPENLASRTLRLSVGRETTKKDIDLFVQNLNNAVSCLQ